MKNFCLLLVLHIFIHFFANDLLASAFHGSSLHGSIDARENVFQVPDTIKQKMNILAFGDSLTKGLFLNATTGIPGYHPYAEHLADSFAHFYKGGSRNMSVYESGINGEKTVGMMHRLVLYLNKLKNLKFVIILGGTNDLGNHLDAKKTLANLIRMHKLVHQQSTIDDPVYSLAVSVPPCPGWPISEVDRVLINQGIRTFATNCSHMVAYLDSDQLLDTATDKARGVYWSSDKVHLSAAGYDELGKALFKVISSFLQQKQTSSTTSSSC